VFLKGGPEFWNNPVNVSLCLGGYSFGAKLLDAYFGRV
jgi:hypothetical protein